MPEIKTKVKTNVVTIVFVALAIALAAVGIEIFIPDLVSSLMPPPASLPATVVVKTTVNPTPIGSTFYPHWLFLKIGGGLPAFYTANGINMGSGDINPATGLAYIRMTKYTTNIGTLAASIPNGTNKHITVQNIMDWMHSPNGGNIQPGGPANNNCNNALRLSRTADQILSSRCATGCTDWAIAFVALARAKGISAANLILVNGRWIQTSIAAGCMHIPKIGHDVADVYTNNGWELADPTTGVYTTYGANGDALMRFDQSTPNRPLQALGNGYKYVVFRRGIDAWDVGITSDSVWATQVISQYGVPSNACTHDNDFYSVADSSNCSSGDTSLGSLKYPFGGSMKLCKKSSLNLNVNLRLGSSCNSGETRAGIFKGPAGVLNWSLCYNDSKISINSIRDSSECALTYNQVGVFIGSDGSSKWKLCYRYIQ